MARFRGVIAVLLACAWAAPAAHAGVWLSGDLHVHTTYSHDSYGGPTDDNTGLDEAYTLGFPVVGEFLLAKTRGLDFLAITDHNDVRSQSDPGFGAFGVIPVPGYENSLNGHAQMLGATQVYPDVDHSSAAAVQAQANQLRADGGVWQINHPANSDTENPDDLDWALGYAVQPDTVEAWNGSPLYEAPLPAANSFDDAVKYWDGWLDRGAKVGLTGGSDSHWLTLAAVAGAGQPTTWVYAADRSVPAILDGLRHGRTFVSNQPPGLLGPKLFLEADADRNGTYESIVGDTVAPGTPMRVRAEGPLGAYIRVVTNGGADAIAPVHTLSLKPEVRFTAPAGKTWVRAELAIEDLQSTRQQVCGLTGLNALIYGYCRNRLLVLSMTSAMYLH
jgi:hypothetical protein